MFADPGALVISGWPPIARERDEAAEENTSALAVFTCSWRCCHVIASRTRAGAFVLTGS